MLNIIETAIWKRTKLNDKTFKVTPQSQRPSVCKKYIAFTKDDKNVYFHSYINFLNDDNFTNWINTFFNMFDVT